MGKGIGNGTLIDFAIPMSLAKFDILNSAGVNSKINLPVILSYVPVCILLYGYNKGLF